MFFGTRFSPKSLLLFHKISLKMLDVEQRLSEPYKEIGECFGRIIKEEGFGVIVERKYKQCHALLPYSGLELNFKRLFSFKKDKDEKGRPVSSQEVAVTPNATCLISPELLSWTRKLYRRFLKNERDMGNPMRNCCQSEVNWEATRRNNIFK
ncbi:hypothetical protein C5167_006370 [Papaver somniferum]|uniref:Uncharacterized protein n=1 Tax=Papaver somniferum TaxID=3469 RepID=A0A4Y7JGA2_PAPSO|nr:hypothetical protein C5167_006370 [Papaver somniferum]